MIRAFLALMVLTAPTFAHAEDYSPEFCNFSVTFPEAPHTQKKCDGHAEDRCYEESSYVKVFNQEASLKFRVICNPVDESAYNHYSPKVMKETLRAMTADHTLQVFETSYSDEKHYKQASLIGEGQEGITPTLYVAQLWIAKSSGLSVEAQLIGGQNDKADQAFSDILKTIKFKE